jgi:hypothetical protein
MALVDKDQHNDTVVVLVVVNKIKELQVVVEEYDDMDVEYIDDHDRNEHDVLLVQMMMVI